MPHEVTRVRHELKHRHLTVRSVGHVTPRMIRVVLEGDDMQGFSSLSPDDHVKLFFPSTAGGAEKRDYTPRRFDTDAGTLTIDFAVHAGGPAIRWARSAAPGHKLTVGGPKGSIIVPADYDWWLLIGDESALPAIGRRIEEAAAGTRIITLAAVTASEEEQNFQTSADLRTLWVHRSIEAASDPAFLLAALKTLELPPGDGFVWIAAEATVARALRDHMTGERRHPISDMKAAGYWVKGQADTNEKFQD
ncbi:MAG TPA: siderophore-interacting protein [Candidatus Sulfotelmatobacter sp.]|jgi:NADPH-dependent ferric siderophore reductase|nr:siderophore-interacting protein [Candidatus Sulfotelmatobacter sp.]